MNHRQKAFIALGAGGAALIVAIVLGGLEGFGAAVIASVAIVVPTLLGLLVAAALVWKQRAENRPSTTFGCGLAGCWVGTVLITAGCNYGAGLSFVAWAFDVTAAVAFAVALATGCTYAYVPRRY